MKVNVVVLPQVLGKRQKPPVFKQGKIGEPETTWCMDSGADMCFIAKNLLPAQYVPCPPVGAQGAMHEDGKMCPTVQFQAVVDGKKTNMLAAVAPSNIPYPAIVGIKEWLWSTYPMGSDCL